MSVSKFYQMELARLKNESDKINFFTKHPTTIGNYRERLLRDYLHHFTPNTLTIGSGFVFEFENAPKDQLYQKQTRQIDCLVYDNNNYAPFLKTADFVIIEPHALYAGIEIKSELTFYKEYDHNETAMSEKYPLKYGSEKPYRWAGTMVGALENIKSIFNIAGTYNQEFFKGIFAYSSKVNYKELLFAFDNGELQKQLSLTHLNELPSYICVLDQSLVTFSRVSLFENESAGFDSSQTEMTVIEAHVGNTAFPLQFFSNIYKAEIEYRLLKKRPHSQGLFTLGLGEIRKWGHHFNLCSE